MNDKPDGIQTMLPVWVSFICPWSYGSKTEEARKKQGNPLSGNSAEDINMKTQKERTFSVNLSSCYTAKDVLKSVRKNVGNAEIAELKRKN